jgi:hypothetical protein
MLSLLVVCFGLIGFDDAPPQDSAARAAYDAARAKAGHDAKAHVRLALWRWPSTMIRPRAWRGG